MRLAILLALAAALLIPAAAAAATTPGKAARATRDCLRAHGWSAVLSDHGLTVNGRAPRKLARYPYRPYVSVSFYRDGARVRSISIHMSTTRGELLTASRCIRQAVTA